MSCTGHSVTISAVMAAAEGWRAHSHLDCWMRRLMRMESVSKMLLHLLAMAASPIRWGAQRHSQVVLRGAGTFKLGMKATRRNQLGFVTHKNACGTRSIPLM